MQDLEEVCQAIDDLVEAEKQTKLLKKIAAIMGVLLALSIAAIVGLTFAVVDLTKEVSNSNGVLSDTSGKALYTGEASLGVSNNPIYDKEMVDWFSGSADLNSTTGMRKLFQVIESSTTTGTGTGGDTSVSGTCTAPKNLKQWGRTEASAVREICDALDSRAVGKYLMVYLRDYKCRSSQTDLTQNETAGGECKTYRTPIEITEINCRALTDTSMWCNNAYAEFVTDPVTKKKVLATNPARAIQEYTIITGEDVRGFHYDINFKRDCGSYQFTTAQQTQKSPIILTNPQGNNWFESAAITQYQCGGEVSGFSEFAPDPEVNAGNTAANVTGDQEAEGKRKLLLKSAAGMTQQQNSVIITVGSGIKMECTAEHGCSRID